MKTTLHTTLILGTLLTLTACNEMGVGGGRNSSKKNPVSSIFGAAAENQNQRSQIHRDQATRTLSYVEEAAAAKNTLPAGFHEMPSVAFSDNGLGSSAVIKAIRPTTNCGVGAASVGDAIADCQSKNISSATWNGVRNGNAGEGSWQLVYFSATQEIWRDETNGLLWSSSVENSNWCNASANDEHASDISTIDCGNLPNRHDTCAILESAIFPALVVSWRLPTRGDFLQADLNGARFVLPGTSLTYWTATVDGANRDNAVTITQQTGALSTDNRINNHPIRCLGRVL